MQRWTMIYVDKILKGARPGEAASAAARHLPPRDQSQNRENS
jgi:hypothetical protein